MSQDPAQSMTSADISSADQPYLAELADQPRDLRKTSWSAVVLVSLFLATVGVMLVVWVLPGELQQWRVATAEEQRLNGDREGAMRLLNEDIQRNPSNIELRRIKSQWLLADKRYQDSLTEVNQIIAWRSDDVSAYALRSQIFHAMGEHGKAVEDCKKILSFDAVSAGPSRAQALNQLAYARALANIEIDDGLVDITEAIRRTGENFPMLDTRGFLYYRNGDLDRALKDLDWAVKFAEDSALVDAGQLPIADRRYKKLADQEEAAMLAVIRYHRGLVHAARKDQTQAEADFRRVRELGFEPNEELF